MVRSHTAKGLSVNRSFIFCKTSEFNEVQCSFLFGKVKCNSSICVISIGTIGAVAFCMQRFFFCFKQLQSAQWRY